MATPPSSYGERPPLQGYRRSFTTPHRRLSYHERAGLDKSDAGAEILFSHPSARIIQFAPSTNSIPLTKSLIPPDTDYPVDTIETLPWASTTETTLASGQLIIEKVQGSTNFLKSGDVQKPILRNSQCWCVDNLSKFVLRVRQFVYYRIELPTKSTEDTAKVEEFKGVLKKILKYEVTPCPFKRGFHVDLPDSALTPRRRGTWKRKEGSLSSPLNDESAIPRLKSSRAWNRRAVSDGRLLNQEASDARVDSEYGDSGDIKTFPRQELDGAGRSGSPSSAASSDPGAESEEHDQESEATRSDQDEPEEEPIHAKEEIEPTQLKAELEETESGEEVGASEEVEEQDFAPPISEPESSISKEEAEPEELKQVEAPELDKEEISELQPDREPESTDAEVHSLEPAGAPHDDEEPAVAEFSPHELADSPDNSAGGLIDPPPSLERSEDAEALVESSDGLSLGHELATTEVQIEDVHVASPPTEGTEISQEISEISELPPTPKTAPMVDDAEDQHPTKTERELPADLSPNEKDEQTSDSLQVTTAEEADIQQATKPILKEDAEAQDETLDDDENGVDDTLSMVSSVDSFHTLASADDLPLNLHMADVFDTDSTPLAEHFDPMVLSSRTHKRDLSELTVTASSTRSAEDEFESPRLNSTPASPIIQEGLRHRLTQRRSLSPLPPAATLFSPSQHQSQGNHLTSAILQKACNLALVKPIEVVVLLVHILARIAGGATVNDLMSGDLFKKPDQNRDHKRNSSLPDQIDLRRDDHTDEDDFGIPIRGRARGSVSVTEEHDHETDSLMDLD